MLNGPEKKSSLWSKMSALEMNGRWNISIENVWCGQTKCYWKL